MHPVDDIRGTKGNDLSGKKIILAVTGSIAAVENVKLARELIRYGADVQVVMSKAATEIVHPDSMWFATGHEPITRLTGAVEHVTHCGETPTRAHLFLVCPSTANTISKMALGIDDTPVTTFATTAIGTGIPVCVVPAMHASMYRHPVVLENIEKLKELGVTFVQPRFEENKAKVADIDRTVLEVRRILSSGKYKGKKVRVIYGGAREPIDDVRFIANASSGNTGVAIARELYIQGADVMVFRSESSVKHGIPCEEKVFSTNDDLIKELEDTSTDLTIIPAALSDFKVEPKEGKIPSGESISIEFKPHVKVLDLLKGPIVAFKAVSNIDDTTLIKRSKELLSDQVKLVIGNDISNAGKASGVYKFVTSEDIVDFSGTKDELAQKLCIEAFDLLK